METGEERSLKGEYLHGNQLESNPKKVTIDQIITQLETDYSNPELQDYKSIAQIEAVKKALVNQLDLSVEVDSNQSWKITKLVLSETGQTDPEAAAELVISQINQINQS